MNRAGSLELILENTVKLLLGVAVLAVIIFLVVDVTSLFFTSGNDNVRADQNFDYLYDQIKRIQDLPQFIAIAKEAGKAGEEVPHGDKTGSVIVHLPNNYLIVSFDTTISQKEKYTLSVDDLFTDYAVDIVRPDKCGQACLCLYKFSSSAEPDITLHTCEDFAGIKKISGDRELVTTQNTDGQSFLKLQIPTSDGVAPFMLDAKEPVNIHISWNSETQELLLETEHVVPEEETVPVEEQGWHIARK